MCLKNSLFLLFFFTPILAFSQRKVIDIKTENTTLLEVISKLEQDYGYLFSYKESDVKNIKIGAAQGRTDIDKFLNAILMDTGLEYEIINGQYIVLKKSSKQDGISSEGKGNEGTQICGFVMDSITQKSLPFASVYLKKSLKGNYAGDNGQFEFKCSASNQDTVVVSYVGYADKYYPIQYFINNPCPTIELRYTNFEIDYIVVTDYLTDGIDLADNGTATVLRPERIGVLPGQVEPDVFSTIQFLPGINNPSGESSDLHVRGGAADQNLILWEGIPIYHSSHYFGMISAFNPYIIDKIKVYRGGFGAEYGGRASSVIDMQSADYDDLEKSQIGAGINLINAYIDGTLTNKKNNLSLVYSLRRSISELWRSPTFDNITHRNQQRIIEGNFDFSNLPKGVQISDDFYFLDSHVKTAVRLSPKDKLTSAFFYGKNKFDNDVSDLQKKERQFDRLDLKSHGFSIVHERDWSSHFSSKLIFTESIYDYDYHYGIDEFDMPPPINRFGTKNNRINELNFHVSNTYSTPRHYDIKFGYQHTHSGVSFEIRHESNLALLANEKADVASSLEDFYASIQSPQENRFGYEMGFRYSHFRILNSNHFAPRLRLWYNMNDHLIWQGNIGRYYQFTSQLVQFRGDFLGINTPIWVLSDDRNVPVIGATQYQFGFVYNNKSWVVDVEAYLKEINGLSSLATAFNAGPTQIKPGSSVSKGIDVLIKKRWKSLRAWASYSLCKATYEFPSFIFPSFPAPFDQRHVLKLASQWNIKSFELAIGFNVYSGTPFSKMEDFKYVTDNMGHQLTAPIYQDYNNYRLPVQHHLDASIVYNFGKKNDTKLNGVVGLSFYNLYQQQNIYDREYFIGRTQTGTDEIKVNDYKNMGFTPNAVLRITW